MAPFYFPNGLAYRNLTTGKLYETFIPGVTKPMYEEAIDFSGRRNVGTNPAAELVPYAGTPYDASPTGNIYRIENSALYENIEFTGIVQVRGATPIFRNCRFILPANFTRSDIIKAIVQLLNGSPTGVVFENCEIHNRAQRPMNGIMGRNFTMRRSAVTGCIDPWSESEDGAAPKTGYGFTLQDCIAPSVAWWYSPTSNPDIHNPDTGSHSDVMQKNTTLSVSLDNCVLAAYCSEIIGTGTPGSGRDAGNPYAPPSGYDFTASQAMMEGWKNAFAKYTTPSQTMTGDVRRLAGAGSLAGVMLNLGNITINKCYFGGGTVQINAADGDVVESTVHITNNRFWNDMANGPGSRTSDPTVKGYAVLFRTGESFGTFTNNLWSDNTPVVIARL